MRNILLLLFFLFGINVWANEYNVGFLYSASSEKTGFYDRCLGTLVAPNIVLTALHCLMDHSGNIKKLDTIQFALGSKTLDEALNTSNKTGIKSKINFKGFQERLKLFANGLGPQLFDEPALLILEESFTFSENKLALGVRSPSSSLSPLFYSLENHDEEGLASYIAQNFSIKKEISSLNKTYSVFRMTNSHLNGSSGSPLIDEDNKVIGIVTTILGHQEGFKGILFDQNTVALFNQVIKQKSSEGMTAYNR